MSVEVQTEGNPDSGYNDSPTTIDLVPSGGDLMTPSLMLVADNVDDDHPVDGVADNARNDRTFLVQLGGSFAVTGVASGSEQTAIAGLAAEVPVVATLNVVLYNCLEGLQDQPVLDASELAIITTAIHERFAQVGVKINLTIQQGIDLGSNGVLSDPPYQNATGQIVIPTESREFFDSEFMPVGESFVAMYAVGGIGPTPGDPKGRATFPSLMNPADVAAGYANKCLMGRNWEIYTAPHELLHILLDAAHADYAFEFGSSIMLWAPSSDNAAISDTKRITPTQENAILGIGANGPASDLINIAE